MQTVAVVFGGRSSEHEISCVSGGAVLSAIDRTRYRVIPVGIRKDGRMQLVPDDPSQYAMDPQHMPTIMGDGPEVLWPSRVGDHMLRVLEDGRVRDVAELDIVFPVLHGRWGEDGTIQGLFELSGVPYVGDGVLASAAGMDKEFTKRILDAAGLEVGRWAAVRRADRADAPSIAADLGYPVFVKPARAGSSVGVSRADGPDELERAVDLAFAEDSKILIEHELRGREVEIAVLGPRTGEEPRVSSVAGEIVVSSGGFYDYRSKYLSAEQATTICPADVTPTQLAALQQAARATFVALDCSGLARVDMFLDGDVVTINEINTLPGFTPISIFPICWEKSGLDYTELITDLLEQAQGR